MWCSSCMCVCVLTNNRLDLIVISVHSCKSLQKWTETMTSWFGAVRHKVVLNYGPYCTMFTFTHWSLDVKICPFFAFIFTNCFVKVTSQLLSWSFINDTCYSNSHSSSTSFTLTYTWTSGPLYLPAGSLGHDQQLVHLCPRLPFNLNFIQVPLKA